ncbi:hypothetical protein ACFFLJ_06240 [Acetobacter farinalis]|uniref:hypothetical protein n=1 Tax=Acetobacter farinalis TaxID=1260984 RepID=UPI0035F2CF2C
MSDLCQCESVGAHLCVLFFCGLSDPQILREISGSVKAESGVSDQMRFEERENM